MPTRKGKKQEHRILCKTPVFRNVDFNQKPYLFPCTPLERAKSAEEVIMTTEKTENKQKCGILTWQAIPHR